MRLQTFSTTVLAALIVLSWSVSTSYAQSRIERSFVPKSRLADKIWTKHDASSKIEIDHDAWDAFLKKFVRSDGDGINRVAYKRVGGADKKALNTYLKALHNVDVTTLNRNEQLAYWVNLYNASTVSIVLKNYPLKSIREVKRNALDFLGPFNDPIAKVNGKTLTLNTIESGIARPIWKDPRLHYVFNCAAISCPNLGKTAYKSATLNAQLNSAARSFVNNPRGVSFSKDGITASKIYFWYEGDFGGSEKSILKHINRYANAKLKSRLNGKKSIDKYVYDWALNEAR